MKNYCFLGFLAFLIAISACKKGEDASSDNDCVAQYINSHGLTPYTGQALDCDFYVALYELDGKQYFYLDCPCADMLSIPEDCEGEGYCASIESPELSYFFLHATRIGIIGIVS